MVVESVDGLEDGPLLAAPHEDAVVGFLGSVVSLVGRFSSRSARMSSSLMSRRFISAMRFSGSSLM